MNLLQNGAERVVVTKKLPRAGNFGVDSPIKVH